MRWKNAVLALTLTLLASPLFAQRVVTRITTVGNLPSVCQPGQPYLVTDGNSGTDCSTGAGSTQHFCICNSAGNGFDAHPAGGDGVGYDEVMEEGSGLTKRAQLNFIGSTITCVDNGGATRTDCTIALPKAHGDFSALDVVPDGQFCLDTYSLAINSGAELQVVECADNDSSVFYAETQLDRYGGGNIQVTLRALNTNATPSGVLDIDFSAQCRGDSDLENSTFGTEVAAAITFDTQNDQETVTTADITPNGTCAAGDTLIIQAAVDATATTTQVADTFIRGFSWLEQ
jgi:hypothetical protein